MTHLFPRLHLAGRQAAADRFKSAGVEPALGEFWSDPIFHAVLARDGLTPCDVRAAIASAGRYRLC